MLILTPGIGEGVRIGANITVTVKEIKGLQVRIGISAPKDVSVLREEIYDRTKSVDTERSSERGDRIGISVIGPGSARAVRLSNSQTQGNR